MVLRLRRFFDVRGGEGLPVLLTFLYIAFVVASFLLAKPIRNSLFLRENGAYSLVYVYAAVPLALSIFVPIYSRIAARIGSRRLTVGTLIFFSVNVLLFWAAFRRYHSADAAPDAPASALSGLLPGVFYVWVNCFAVIAPVQAWSFANSLFDTRQAKRLFGLISAGASLGGIGAGLLATYLVGPVGGTVNLLLVLAALILCAAGIVVTANLVIRRKGASTRAQRARNPFRDSVRQIRGSRYLMLMVAIVFLVAIATQWTNFQLSLAAQRRFGADTDAVTAFFGTFNFVLGIVSFLLQLLLTGPLLRRFGLGAAILILPIALGFGSSLIVLAPAFWAVMVTNGLDQGLRFSLDKAGYELLYLPLPPGQRGPLKNTIDIVVNRLADAIGAVLLGLATRGFFFMPGLGLDLRGTAALNLFIIGGWGAVAWQLRREYVRTIQESIHRHRIDSERLAATTLEAATSGVLRLKLEAANPDDVRYALDLISGQPVKPWYPALRRLLGHDAADIRRRALALLAADGDREAAAHVRRMLRDPDLGVRTEALLYVTREQGVDPLRQIEELGDFQDFSIRAGMAAFLAAPGPSQNIEAARLLIEAMARSEGADGVRDRLEAARLLATVPESFHDLCPELIADEDVAVAKQAIQSAATSHAAALIPPLIGALGRRDTAAAASEALARRGNDVVPEIRRRLDDEGTPADVRYELPGVLVRIGTAAAEQVLLESLLQPDVTLRHRIVISLNKLQATHPGVLVDASVIELALAAEIAGHYRSYQVLGPLRAQLKEEDPILQALQASMEQELERIFRLMNLLFPTSALHDAYVGVRSSNQLVRANALEFLENVLKPELRQVLLPILDSQVSVDERIAIANGLVGAPLETAEQAVGTLLASEDGWLRSCAVYAVGALQLHGLEKELRRLDAREDPALRAAVQTARQRLAGEPEVDQPQQPIPADMNMNVGAG